MTTAWLIPITSVVGEVAVYQPARMHSSFHEIEHEYNLTRSLPASHLSQFAKMAPFVQDSVTPDIVSMANIESKSAALNHDRVQKPVADDFMYDFKYNHHLPTTDILGVDIPADCDAKKEAEGIVARLAKTMSEGDAQAFAGLFLDYGTTLTKQDLKPFGL